MFISTFFVGLWSILISGSRAFYLSHRIGFIRAKKKECHNANIVHDRKPLSPREFVTYFHSLYFNASYTVVPVLDGQLLDLPFHLRRCYKSARLLVNSEWKPGSDETPWCDFLSEYNDAISRSKPALTGPGVLTICTALISSSEWKVSAQFNSMEFDRLSLLNIPLFSDVAVQLVQHQRRMPSAKAASWTLGRSPLELRQNKTAIEMVMCSADGSCLLEGLTSSVFVVKGTILMTAPDTMALKGSMASLVERFADTMGMTTIHAAPLLEDCNAWDAAFLTSATKPIVPIRRILDADGNIVREFPAELPHVLIALVHSVRQGIYCNSTPLGMTLWHDPRSPVSLN